jgi:predicted AAA+ superfamily ATPase
MEKIKFYLRWWFDYELPFYVEREFDSSIVNTNLIAVLVGARRSGKSTLFYQLINSYKKKIPVSNIIYINFEDDRLAPLEGKELSVLLNIFRQNYRYDENYPIYLFLDEIQNLPGWEKTVRRLYDTEKVKIFITGSNSKLLSREISTALRGRTLSSKVNQLSFTEYLKFNNIPVPDLNDLRYSEQKDKIIFLFDKYLRYGGFPEVVLAENEHLRDRILQEYMNTIFTRGYYWRYEIRQFKVMDIYLKMLCRQPDRYSARKMQNLLKSLGFKVSKNTLIEYLSYMEGSFFRKKYNDILYSIKDQLQYPRKFYLLDNAYLRNIIH